jgi:hypothetical protein
MQHTCAANRQAVRTGSRSTSSAKTARRSPRHGPSEQTMWTHAACEHDRAEVEEEAAACPAFALSPRARNSVERPSHAHQVDPLEPVLVEQPEHVARHRPAVVTLTWRVGQPNPRRSGQSTRARGGSSGIIRRQRYQCCDQPRSITIDLPWPACARCIRRSPIDEEVLHAANLRNRVSAPHVRVMPPRAARSECLAGRCSGAADRRRAPARAAAPSC